MTAEQHAKAEAIQATAKQIQKDAAEFQHAINIAAMKSKSPATYGAHVLAKEIKKMISDWEKTLIDKANEAYAKI